MRNAFLRAISVTALTAAAVVLIAGCETKGPAERAGERIDRGIEDARDAVNPPAGPAERAGRAADRATRP
jgi:hypothetical protein